MRQSLDEPQLFLLQENQRHPPRFTNLLAFPRRIQLNELARFQRLCINVKLTCLWRIVMSIFLLIPQTISARIWIADHISREGREVISGQGSFDVQVCGPESLRLTGHCLYLTLDQLKRFKQAVPELFERSRN